MMGGGPLDQPVALIAIILGIILPILIIALNRD